MSSELAAKVAQRLSQLCQTPKMMAQREWIFATEGKVFVRVTQRAINGALRPTIDVATIEIDEEHQNTGVFKQVLFAVEQVAQQHNRCVFVENVLNEILVAPLQKYGYTLLADSFPPSFAKDVNMKPKYKTKI